MSLKTRTLSIDGAEYTIRELPVGFLRVHQDFTDPSAQIDLIGWCVLGDDGKPLSTSADTAVPMRHLEPLLTAIIEHSGLGKGPDA